MGERNNYVKNKAIIIRFLINTEFIYKLHEYFSVLLFLFQTIFNVAKIFFIFRGR